LYSLDIYAQYWRGALERAAGLGYKLDEFRLADEGMSAARIAQILKARGIQGILIPPSEDGVLRKIEMPWENFATIRFGYSMPSIPTHLVSNTQFDTAREAVLRARALGAQRIGYYFHASGEQKTRNHFLGGYLVGRQGTGAIARIPPLMAKSPDKSAHRTEFLRWFRKHRPDCVLTQYGGAVSWILEEGKSIPGDVKVIHLSLPAKSEMILSGMSQNSLEIGKQAVELLARLLRNGETGLPAIPLELLVPGVWVQGDSA
jgi:LacI family transcriptional regulator/LacI family repressor for deo operon, udp, cdd, tsx, nupC, and nupG